MGSESQEHGEKTESKMEEKKDVEICRYDRFGTEMGIRQEHARCLVMMPRMVLGG